MCSRRIGPRDDPKIAWYENTDGAGNFGPQQVITTLADGTIPSTLPISTVTLMWMCFRPRGEITRLLGMRTLMDQETFGQQHVIATLDGDARSVFAVDLDGDGDSDVLSASGGLHARKEEDYLVREHRWAGDIRCAENDRSHVETTRCVYRR